MRCCLRFLKGRNALQGLHACASPTPSPQIQETYKNTDCVSLSPSSPLSLSACFLLLSLYSKGPRVSVVGWGTVLQAGRSQVRFQDAFIGLFNWFNPSSRIMALGSTLPLTEMSIRNLFRGAKGGRRVGLKTLPPSVCRWSRQNMGPSTSHSPMGLHGLLQG
jgi:hypothetical protein